MIISLLQVVYVLVAVVNTSIGIFVLYKGWKKRSNVIFFFVVLVINGWLLSNYFSYFPTSGNILLAARFAYFFASMLMPLLILLVYNFPSKHRVNWPIHALVSLPALVSLYLSFGKWFVEDVLVRNTINLYVSGPLHPVYATTIGIYLIVYVSVYYKRFRASRPMDQVKLRYVFIGLAVPALCNIYFDLLYPYINHIKASPGGVFGSPTTIVFSIATAYAIIRYRLLDIAIVIRKSLVQFVTFVLLFAIYAYALLLVQRSTSSTFTLSSNTSLLVTIFIIGLTIEPLRKGIYKFIDGIVTNREKDRQEALKRMQLMAASTMQFQTLLERTQQELGKTFGVQVNFLLAERRVQALTQFPAGQMKVQLEDVVGQRIASGKVLIGDELPYRIENGETSLKVVHDWMQANDVSAIVPIGAGEDMVGAFLFRGMGKVVYTADMVRFMKDFQEQSTFAFASAYAYKLAVERIGVKQ